MADWLPPLPKAIPILTSGVDTNEYRSAFPPRIGVTRSCKNMYEKGQAVAGSELEESI